MADIPWTWLAIRASGITTWGLLTAVVVWGILLKTQLLGRLAPPMRLLDLHRWLGAIALGFLLVHMGFLLIDPSVSFTVWQILVPGTAPWETLAVALGTIAFWLLVPVSFLGRLRAKMGLAGNRWFKRVHLAAYAAWPLATAHYVLAGTDALAEWSLALLFSGTALVVMGLLARGFVPAPGPTRTFSDSEGLTSA
jgi:methionine sulfoxide reductase heme-binding subunit